MTRYLKRSIRYLGDIITSFIRYQKLKHCSIYQDQIEDLMETLIESIELEDDYKFKKLFKHLPQYLNTEDSQGYTLLDTAVLFNNSHIIYFLVEKGATITDHTLDQASNNVDLEMIHYLRDMKDRQNLSKGE